MSATAPRRPLTLWRLYRPTILPGTVAMLVLALLAFVGLRALDDVGAQTRLIVTRGLDASTRISALAARTRALNGEPYRLLAQQAAGGKTITLGPALHAVADEAAKLETALRDDRDHFAEPRQAPALNQAIADLERYRGAALALSGRTAPTLAAGVALLAPLDGTPDRLAAHLLSVADETVRDARALSTAATDTTRHTGRYLLVMTLVIAASISLLAWRFGRRQQSILLTRQALEAQVAQRTAELDAARIEAETALAEMQRARKQLVDAEQMAALGALVAGVAHEINTPVGTSLTAATLLEERTRHFRDLVAANQLKRTDLARYLDVASETTGLMLSNIHRAASLIQSFKQVAVDQTSAERRLFELAPYLEEVITSLSPQLRKSSAKLATACDPGIDMDSFPGALAQVITNFVMNALTHAFADGRGGTITITAARLPPDHVEMIFADTGRGIPADIIGRIFEPFFTTRRGAGGTGLGLHIVYNIVTQQLGGTLTVESTEGQGTRFTVTLPIRAPR